jgi:hypothetical protein
VERRRDRHLNHADIAVVPVGLVTVVASSFTHGMARAVLFTISCGLFVYFLARAWLLSRSKGR